VTFLGVQIGEGVFLPDPTPRRVLREASTEKRKVLLQLHSIILTPEHQTKN